VKQTRGPGLNPNSQNSTPQSTGPDPQSTSSRLGSQLQSKAKAAYEGASVGVQKTRVRTRRKYIPGLSPQPLLGLCKAHCTEYPNVKPIKASQICAYTLQR
jgi:hypothetical protein